MAIAPDTRIGDLEQTVRIAAYRKLHNELFAKFAEVVTLLQNAGVSSYASLGLYSQSSGESRALFREKFAEDAASAILEATKDEVGKRAMGQFVDRVVNLVE